MWFDSEQENREKKQRQEMEEQAEKRRKEIAASNESLMIPPPDFSMEEQVVWKEIATLVISGTNYKKTVADSELLRQYCQIKIIRDRAWKAFSDNPERYTRIITGICSDGKTPRVMVKENEHYKTLHECNKQLEKLLKDLRLTPEARRK